MGIHTLKPETRRNIERCVSLEFSEIVDNGHDTARRLGKKVVYSLKRDSRKSGRGNPLLARKRFRTIEDVNKKLAEIKNADAE